LQQALVGASDKLTNQPFDLGALSAKSAKNQSKKPSQDGFFVSATLLFSSYKFETMSF
jgi:hypothetical protein